MLEIDSVYLSYNEKILLRSVYIKIPSEEITGLLGVNGSGKTQLLETIYGTNSSSQKSIRLNSITIKTPYISSGLINILPQEQFIPNFLSLLSVFNFYSIDINLFLSEFPEFKGLAKQKINNFSSGQKKLIEIYLVIYSKTLFTLLDEPFSYLMPIHVEQISEIIKRKKSEKGFLITDHQYNHVLELSNQVYLLKDGQTSLINNIEQLKNNNYLP